MIEKSKIIESIIHRLREELRVMEEARSMANEEAMPSDDTTESQRENRALENQYLVDGQGKVAQEHKDAIHAYETLVPRPFAEHETAALGALVEVELGGERTLYFLGPRAGGLDIAVNGTTVYVLTPQSPLGRKLIGRNIGDTVVIEEGAGGRTARILALA